MFARCTDTADTCWGPVGVVLREHARAATVQTATAYTPTCARLIVPPSVYAASVRECPLLRSTRIRAARAFRAGARVPFLAEAAALHVERGAPTDESVRTSPRRWGPCRRWLRTTRGDCPADRPAARCQPVPGRV